MAYVNIVTILAVLQFIVFGFKVGSARERFGVKAPATAGNETFERYFRVQQNTLEQLVAFLPGIYLFGHYWNPLWAAGLGVVYLIGREMYSMGYVKDPAKRGAGFGVSALPVVVLLGGALIGAIRAAIT
ncbi:MAG TPA: MAPEG family protein [Steroidobacteraceae bacterium]|nr:MAPEG family protein [Steroidobacteraceae bacterium]